MASINGYKRRCCLYRCLFIYGENRVAGIGVDEASINIKFPDKRRIKYNCISMPCSRVRTGAYKMKPVFVIIVLFTVINKVIICIITLVYPT